MIYFGCSFLFNTELCIIEYFVFYIQLFCIVAYIFLFIYCSIYVITTIGEKEDYEPSSLLLKPRHYCIYIFVFIFVYAKYFMKYIFLFEYIYIA